MKLEAVTDHEEAATHTRAVISHTNQQKPFEEKPAGQNVNKQLFQLFFF